MYRYRGFILSFVLCFAVQLAIFRGLEGLGVREAKIWAVEVVALGATVWITIGIGERFERK
jgi:hypothetical protein